MNDFLSAVHAAARRIIAERCYIAHPDDVDDITISQESRAWPELAAIDAALVASAEARRAVGLGAEEQVPAGYGIGFMFRWLSEYRDAGGSFHHLDDVVVGTLAERLQEFAAAALRLADITGLAAGAHVVAIQPPAFSLPATQVKAIRIGRTAMPGMTIRQPELLGEKAAEVRELFTKLDANHDRALAFAVRRFNDADERARDEDVLFDCFSALEALFADGATTEITYRLSLRAAKVLRATTEERVELFRRIKKLYATRSKVVHGEQVPRQRLVEDGADARALLRAAVIAWLDSGGYDGDELDELLLS